MSPTSPPSSPSTSVVPVVVGCVVLCVAVAVIVIYRRRGTGVIDNRTTTNQDTGQSADTMTYSVISHPVTRPKEKHRDTEEQFTEYATINTAH
ncbi:hypothetical protein AAFF_G00118820 [Aldrovandia affinis]|uniref:Uncharacterized protein n=1 Tax=Aldrovandia affinis TaxID=143900 RepID=A0AAD7R1N9_9TELE|nr:hypothetical protein AAFF_G00118820 [Aldrovandia affinis]